MSSTRKRQRVEAVTAPSDSEPEFQDALEYPTSTLHSFRELLNARIASAASSGVNNSIETEEELLLFVRQIPTLSRTLAQELNNTKNLKMSMPIPGTKDAPRFDGSKPLEIPRFLDILEELFSLHSITDANEKRRWMLKYIPRELEDQWKEFPKFETATWDETKDIVKSQYPEIGISGTALLARLDAIVRANSRLNLEDPQRCYEAIRQFRPGVRDLVKNGSLMSGWEVVQVFLKMFTPTASSEIQQTLRVKKLVKNSNGTAAGAANDFFTLDEVIETVQEMVKERRSNSLSSAVEEAEEKVNSERAIDRFSRSMAVEPAVVKREDFDELNATMAKFKDSLEIQQKSQNEINKAMLSKMQEMMNSVSSPAPQTYNTGSSGGGYGRGNSGPRNFTCYYCNSPDHGVNMCPVKDTDLQAGLIYYNQQKRLCARDGTDLRTLPGTFDKQRLDNYNASKSKSQSMLQTYPTGSVQYSGFVQQHVEQTDEEPKTESKGVIEMSSIEKMIQKMVEESMQKAKANFQ